MIFYETGKISEDIFLLDVMGWRHGKTTACYFVYGEQIALFDPGGYSSGKVVLEFLRNTSIPFEKVKYIFVSHRHNDHSGGASFLVRYIPDAIIYAHRYTVDNLLNPEKINKATREMYGEFSEDIEPVDPSRVKILSNGDSFSLGKGIEIVAHHMPGHTSDHFMFYEIKNSFIFTGDGAGLFSPDTLQIIPNSFPPSFRYNEYRKTLQKLIELKPVIAGFSHFGAASGKDLERLLLSAIHTLDEWKYMVEKGEYDGLRKKYLPGFSLFSKEFRSVVMDTIIAGFQNGITRE